MLFIALVLWITAVVLMLADPRRTSVRWLAAVAFCGGCGGFAVVLHESIRPYLNAQGISLRADSVLHTLQSVFSLTNYYGLPYCFLMFAFFFRGSGFASVGRSKLGWLLLVPPAATFALSPPYTPEAPVLYPAICAWAVPYILAGAWIVAAAPSPGLSMRRPHLLVKLAVVPPTLFALTVGYVLSLFDIHRMWRYNPWLIGFAFAVFVVAMFKTGFLGVRLYIERKRLDTTLQAVTSGTAILNHAIQNDLGKIDLYCHKLERFAETSGHPELSDDLRVIRNATRHIREMIARVQGQTRDLQLVETVASLSELVEPALLADHPPSVRVIRRFDPDLCLLCDKAQIVEVLTNPVRNAFDAMPEGGELEIVLERGKRQAAIEVRDAGCGMDREQARKALDPFYTTKGGSHFGLGLAYCYQVMKKTRRQPGISERTRPGDPRSTAVSRRTNR